MRSPAEVEVDWRFAAADQDRAARFFSEQGFVAFSDLVGADELGRLRDAYDECVADGRIRRLDHGMVVENDVVLMHEAFAAIIDSDALVGAARALLGGVAVELQHSKITQRTLEDSGEGVLEWHQDFPFFPHTNYDLIAVHRPPRRRGRRHRPDPGPARQPSRRPAHARRTERRVRLPTDRARG